MESATPDVRARDRLAQISAVLGDDLPTLSRALHEVLASEIVELDGDQLMLDLLRASGESNVETFLHFARYDIPIEEIEAPAAALEYSRRLAQRGISSNALQRAYRLGQRHVMRIALDLIAEHEPDREVALATGMVLLDKAFAYIDAVSEKVVSEYEEERERWLANRTTVRATARRAVLCGDAVEEAAAEQALGYRLRRDHVGLVAWSVGVTPGAALVRDLERAVGGVAEAYGVGAPLFMPQDRSLAWAWIPRGRRSAALDPVAIAALVLEHGAGLRVAMGSVGSGIQGFVATHREALRAHQVAATAGPRSAVVTAWGEPGVRSAAVLARDLPTTRELVASALGALGADDEAMERLRETLWTFLDQRRSYLATAERLHLHRNTVKYRVDKAVSARGRGLDEDRLDLELALLACRHLGATVLTG